MREAFLLVRDLVIAIKVDAEARRGVLRKKLSAKYRQCDVLLVLMRLHRQKYDALVAEV